MTWLTLVDRDNDPVRVLDALGKEVGNGLWLDERCVHKGHQGVDCFFRQGIKPDGEGRQHPSLGKGILDDLRRRDHVLLEGLLPPRWADNDDVGTRDCLKQAECVIKKGRAMEAKECLGTPHAPGSAGSQHDAADKEVRHEIRGTSMRDSRVEPTS
jgi:hypothetical protein